MHITPSGEKLVTVIPGDGIGPEVVGVDIFVESGDQAEDLGPAIEELTSGLPARLKMISSRGTKVYPSMGAMTDYVDHWRCRFIPLREGNEVSDETITALMGRIASRYRWMHVEKLQEYDGEPVFSKAQGED